MRSLFLFVTVWIVLAVTPSFGSGSHFISEPPDLTSNLANPTAVGTISAGTTYLSGSIDGYMDEFGFESGDVADSFEFVVPANHRVTSIKLEITNFASTERAEGYLRNFSGGTSSHFFSGNTTFSNLVNVSEGLGPGIYDLQIATYFEVDPETYQGIGSLSHDWKITILTERTWYVESSDLTSNLAIPTVIGTIEAGMQVVSGSIDGYMDEFGLESGDVADSFEFVVPANHRVTSIKLEITNFASTEGAEGYLRNFSGGTSSHFFSGDTTFSNLVNVSEGLGPGTYDLQIATYFEKDPETYQGIGSLSLDWKLVFTVETDGFLPNDQVGVTGGGLGIELIDDDCIEFMTDGASRADDRLTGIFTYSFTMEYTALANGTGNQGFTGLQLYDGATEKFAVGTNFFSSNWGGYGRPSGDFNFDLLDSTNSTVPLSTGSSEDITVTIKMVAGSDDSITVNFRGQDNVFTGPVSFDQVRLRSGGNTVNVTNIQFEFSAPQAASVQFVSYSAPNFLFIATELDPDWDYGVYGTNDINGDWFYWGGIGGTDTGYPPFSLPVGSEDQYFIQLRPQP